MHITLFDSELRLMELLWEAGPTSAKALSLTAAEAIGWNKNTTYTVLKKVCSRGIFKLEKKMVTVLIPKDEFYAIQSENFVNKDFSGSLPAFLAAFTSRRKLSEKEISEIRQMLDSYTEK